MTTYALSIDRLSVQPLVGDLVNVVRAVQWRLVSSNGETAEMAGIVELAEPDPRTFTPFERLQAKQVEAWVMAAIPSLDDLKASLAKRWLAPPWGSP
jgi:hypothetical protein